jgi:hypothetical protein
VEELRNLDPSSDVVGYRAGFRYCISGRMLRGSLYPPATVLYRRTAGRYVQDGHTQRLKASGRIEALQGFILHDDRKPITRWFASQVRYARLEADVLHEKRWRELAWPDRLRRFYVVMPPVAFVYCLTVAGGILDGWPGLHYAFQRAIAEAMLSLALIGRKLRGLVAKLRKPF